MDSEDEGSDEPELLPERSKLEQGVISQDITYLKRLHGLPVFRLQHEGMATTQEHFQTVGFFADCWPPSLRLLGVDRPGQPGCCVLQCDCVIVSADYFVLGLLARRQTLWLCGRCCQALLPASAHPQQAQKAQLGQSRVWR